VTEGAASSRDISNIHENGGRKGKKVHEGGSDLTVDEVGKRIDDFCDVGRDNVVLKLEF
jgi:hypothetical protein